MDYGYIRWQSWHHHLNINTINRQNNKPHTAETFKDSEFVKWDMDYEYESMTLLTSSQLQVSILLSIISFCEKWLILVG